MGVPKFFRYISERYPCLSELVKENQIPEFDNLYLDMNGIIHNCSHPDDGNVQFRITEEQIFLDVFHYIDTLFRMIQPQKLFFMAVDGVAPRAKMNQQRGRRFRSAKEAETLELEAMNRGEKLPETERFDSNCITPGTAFMVRLQNALKHFIKTKISNNELWQKCTIILSGHETPGEGEHKIMEYIRFLKANPAYNPNTRHCLYGLDADLVMLGLCTHDNHFSLLREEVKFGSKAKKNTSVDTTRFFLLHLGLFREYLELEFDSIKHAISFTYDIENIVDDWIFLCYLVGNDFIPHLPNFHINTNALPILYTAYKKVLPQLDGYINECGILNLPRLEVFLNELGQLDNELFQKQNANLDLFKGTQMDNDATFNVDVNEITEGSVGDGGDNDLMALVQSTNEMFDEDYSEDLFPEELAHLDDDAREFYLHKRNYYISKLGYKEMTPEVLAEQTECYIQALQWTLYYYYRGVKSWSWYYPHHYAPYISDVKNFNHLKINFDIGKPFLPFQQLLAVLPAGSKAHLPQAYHDLMTDENSKVIDYYPTKFDTDLNGKKQDWEAVVLIPFIDEKRLLAAMSECENRLTPDEVDRNVHGPMFEYVFTDVDQGPLEASHGLSELQHTYFAEKMVWRDSIAVDEKHMILGPSTGALKDVYFPGFPTLKHIQYTGSLKFKQIRVFDMSSRNESMIIRVNTNNKYISDDAPINLTNIGKSLWQKEIFVGWPHLTEAKVIAVCTQDILFHEGAIQKGDIKVFDIQARALSSHYITRMGIDVGAIEVLVIAKPLVNRQYIFGAQGKMTLEKVWSEITFYYPLQTIVEDITIHNPAFVQYKQVEDIFVKDSIVFMVSTIYYGSKGYVVDPKPVKTCGRIKVNLTVYPEPDFTLARKIHLECASFYDAAYSAAASIGLSYSVFSAITGSFFVVLGDRRFPLPDNSPKLNIGLQLKFPKRNEEVAGYTKKIGTQFMYSRAAIDAVEEYCNTWPEVFEYVSANNTNNINNTCFETSIFGSETGKLSKVHQWLKEQPHTKAERRTVGTKSLDSDAIKAVIKSVEDIQNLPVKSIKLQVKPHLLYKPNLNDNKTAPDVTAKFDLFDRVVLCRATHTVPLGYKGTIIAIHSLVDPNPVRQECLRKIDMYYEVLFDSQFDDGGSIPDIAIDKRVFRVSELNLLNISYGINKFSDNNTAMVNVSNSFNKQSSFSSTASTETIAPVIQKSADNIKKENDIWEMLKKSNGKLPAQLPAQLLPVSELESKVLTTAAAASTNMDPTAVLMEKLKIGVPQPPAVEEFRKINVDDLFNVNLTKLPKPPTTWQNKPSPTKKQPQQQANAAVVAPTMAMPPTNNANNLKSGTNLYYAPQPNGTFFPQHNAQSEQLYHPQPTNSFMYQQANNSRSGGGGASHKPTPQQLSQSSNNYQSSQYFYNKNQIHTPQGPQNLSNNSFHLPGHGAFIPLQATRKNLRGSRLQQQQQQQQQRQQPPKPQSPNPESKSNSHKKTIDDNLVNNVNSNKKTEDINQVEKKIFVPPKQRSSRIAAKFDHK